MSEQVRRDRVELSAGPIEYVDRGPVTGMPVVLLHGLLMDSSLWDQVLAELPADYRCLAPTLPMGAHRLPMPQADLSLAGLADLVGEFLDRLDLQDVTLVGNDTGGALIQLLLRREQLRVGRIVLTSCEAFDNFPARLTGTALVLSGRLPPPLFGLFLQQLRLRPVRRLPIAFGRLTRRGDAVTAGWPAPALHQREIRHDAVRMLRAVAKDSAALAGAAGNLERFPGPALVVWAAGDRVMPPEHGRRLAGLLPAGRMVEIEDSSTLIPLDQPQRLAGLIRDFVPAKA